MTPEDSNTELVLAVKVQEHDGRYVEYHHVDEDMTDLGIQCLGCGSAFQDDESPGLAIVDLPHARAKLLRGHPETYPTPDTDKHFRCGSCGTLYPCVLMPEHLVIF